VNSDPDKVDFDPHVDRKLHLLSFLCEAVAEFLSERSWFPSVSLSFRFRRMYKGRPMWLLHSRIGVTKKLRANIRTLLNT